MADQQWTEAIIGSILTAPDDSAAAIAVTGALDSRSESPIPADIEKLLGGLRKRRHFRAMARLADGLLVRGATGPYVRRQYGQALIELGLLEIADGLLRDLIDRLPAGEVKERSETYGLLGRANKQRFVSFALDRERAAKALQTAVGYYKECYHLDPAWHGANLVALVNRAERDGLFPGDKRTSQEIARALLADLAKIDQTAWTPWTYTAAAQAHMALEEWEAVCTNYGVFANAGDVDGFAIGAETRQLREIWGIPPGGDHPASNLLLALETKVLTGTGGSVKYSASELAAVSSTAQDVRTGGKDMTGELQAVFGHNHTQPLKTVLQLCDASSRVCQVVDRDLHAQGIKSGGTGFLVAGATLGLDGAILVTNNHVLSSDGRSPSVRHQDADAIFHFWNGKDQRKRFRVQELAWECPREQLDVALARIVDDEGHAPDVAATIGIDGEPPALRRVDDEDPDRVFLIGHPDGRGLELSLSDNDVKDHEVLDQPRPPLCRIHYGAPTESGMSGSPVLDSRKFQVVGLHRVGRAKPLRSQPKTAYEANEAVWFGSIVAARIAAKG